MQTTLRVYMIKNDQFTWHMLIDKHTTECDVAVFIEDITTSVILGVDCEGYNFGRNGILSIIQIATKKAIYIVDFLDVFYECPCIVKAIRSVLSNQFIIKVIHDGQMDADILHHKHGINLENVHDTQVFHSVLYGKSNVNLNVMLKSHGFHINENRNSGVYLKNPGFWLQRPLTETMRNWAAGDVRYLIDIYYRQKDIAESRCQRLYCMSESKRRLVKCINATTGHIIVKPNQIKYFIGKCGQNIKQIIKLSGVYISGPTKKNVFTYYANSVSQLLLLQMICHDYLEYPMLMSSSYTDGATVNTKNNYRPTLPI